MKAPCSSVQNGCKVRKLASEYLTFENCQSIEKIEREECFGLCPSAYKNKLFFSNQNLLPASGCKCCQPLETYNQTVPIKCLSGSNQQIYNATYQRITSCYCQDCH